MSHLAHRNRYVVSQEEAEDEGFRAAADRFLELGENPYSSDPEDEDRFFNPEAARAWADGWRRATERKLRSTLGGSH